MIKMGIKKGLLDCSTLNRSEQLDKLINAVMIKSYK
ncbi:hypothetical protein C3733_19905 [Bacillus amyloliquefaciens]|nr:hypothetical protein C3733_19905 [Bacillus amyloliquefaciens]